MPMLTCLSKHVSNLILAFSSIKTYLSAKVDVSYIVLFLPPCSCDSHTLLFNRLVHLIDSGLFSHTLKSGDQTRLLTKV